MFILIKYMLGNVYISVTLINFNKVYILGKVFEILSISFLYPKEFFTYNFTARNKRFFTGATST